jgi:hypothetical protein
MTDEQRYDFDNLILLCPNHHARIDDLEPDRFTVEMRSVTVEIDFELDGALARPGEIFAWPRSR